MLKVLRYGVWAALLGVVVGVAAAGLGLWPGGERNAGSGAVGAPFTLTAMTGEPYSWGPETDTPHAIFFGFTFCPDVCPTTLYEMATWLEQLGSDGEAIKALFITIDPERDTPEKLASYISAFDDRILGLTGSTEALEKVAKDFRIYARKVPLDDGDYTMDHTASILLFRPDGSFFGTIAYGEDTDTAVSKLRKLARS